MGHKFTLYVIFLIISIGGCRSLKGNDGGSQPINDNELIEMQRAVNQCHKTGGTRIVKIKGTLKCF